MKLFDARRGGLVLLATAFFAGVGAGSGARAAAGEPPIVGRWQAHELPKARPGPVHAISADGTMLAIGALRREGGLYVWDVRQGKPKHVLEKPAPRPAPGPVPSMRPMVFSADGKQLAVFDYVEVLTGPPLMPPGAPDRLRIWDVARGTLTRELDVPRVSGLGIPVLPNLALSRDGRRIAACFQLSNQPITVWDTRYGRVEAKFPTKLGASYFTFSPDGEKLAAVIDGRLQLFHLASRKKQVFANRDGLLPWFRPIAFTEDGKTIVALSEDPRQKGKNLRIKCWDAQSGAVQRSPGLVAVADTHNPLTWAMAADTATLAVRTGARTVQVWDAATAKLRTSVTAPGDIGEMCLSRSGRFLFLSTTFAGELIGWDVSKPRDAKEKTRPAPGSLETPQR